MRNNWLTLGAATAMLLSSTIPDFAAESGGAGSSGGASSIGAPLAAATPITAGGAAGVAAAVLSDVGRLELAGIGGAGLICAIVCGGGSSGGTTTTTTTGTH